MSKMRPPAISHEKSAAGPAITEALKAPNSHPEPIIEPIAANRSPIGPTFRLSFTGPFEPSLEAPFDGLFSFPECDDFACIDTASPLHVENDPCFHRVVGEAATQGGSGSPRRGVS